jgi:tetratricopeptide (TPR) repeat protein
MKKQQFKIEFILVLLVVGFVVSLLQPRTPTDQATAASTLFPLPDTNQEKLWEEHFGMAGLALKDNDFESARQHLEKARALAVDFPPGDRRLAETLDDLGLVYFSMGKPEQAAQIQGSAVAALLMSSGPDDPDLTIYMERYGWAVTKAAGNSSPPTPKEPYRFIADHATGASNQRMVEELKALEAAYWKSGDRVASDFLNDILKGPRRPFQ